MFFTTLAGLVQSTPAFGWEDPIIGEFHHETMTKDAGRNARATWSTAAAAEMAWHCDYVDAYLYNPLWWAPGGMSRLKAALATGPALAKLHFDDLTSAEQIQTMWRRYTSGAVAGLLWAWQRNDVDGARNVIGASLHALQDFYSHSNWMDDPARRNTTYQEISPQRRLQLPLWTGSYEQGAHLGVKPHGKPNLWCGLLTDGVVDKFMKIACHAASPLGNSSMCQAWRECQDSQVARPKSVLGIPIPANVFYLAPAGIAIDSKWQADIARQVRDLRDLSGQQLFEQTKSLATKQSTEWLDHLEHVMNTAGAGQFWNSIRLGPVTRGARERQYENFSLLPHLFLAAGSYPPRRGESADAWYLRVRLKTGQEQGAGTDSDIYAHFPDKTSFLLDYMPRANPLLAYNDFEAGDDQVHVLGPFIGMPAWLELENRSATVADVFKALGEAFIDAVESAVKKVYDTLLLLFGGQADFVGQAKKVWSPAELSALEDGRKQDFKLSIDGGGEGKWEVHGTISRVGRQQKDSRKWSSYAVHLNKLYCKKESEWDVFSTSDEPLVQALLVNQAEERVQQYSALFSGVDTGESRTLDTRWDTVWIPDGIGYLTLPVQMFESDQESQSDRDKAMKTFAERVKLDLAPGRAEFLDALAASVAADWKLSRLEVFAFTRGETVTVGSAFSGDVNRWIRGRERARFALKLDKPQTVSVWPELLPPQTTTVLLTSLSHRAKWQGAQLTDDKGNTRNTQSLPWNGSDRDSHGFVRLDSIKLENGTTTVALRTHPMWVDNGTVKGWHPDVTLPAGARFEAQVGFVHGATSTNGVRFRVFAHHTKTDGRRVWDQVIEAHKTYTGKLVTIQADLSHLAGLSVGLELRVDAGSNSKQDWAAWVNPRIMGNTINTRK